MSEFRGGKTPPRTRYRGRFAPSPTGSLHLGSLLTALASFLQARSRQGDWLLRIDDLDPERSLPAAADDIKRTLEQFGLLWDGEVTFQRHRTDRYQQAFDRLMQDRMVYHCTCSRRRLAGKAVYPGYCRNNHLPGRNASHATRLSTNDAAIRFRDRLHGTMWQDLERTTGDFVVRRRDGVFAYHLATVVDDADAEVSEVVRGADLLDSTPRQVYLQQLLDLPTPAYCHTPILVDAAGEKLSKQTFAAPVTLEKPEWTLYRLLRLLRQEPPEELERTSTTEILHWATAHWNIVPLQRMRTIALDTTPRSPRETKAESMTVGGA